MPPDTIERRGITTETDRAKLTVEELAARFHSEMIPLTGKFSYFSTLPVAEEDLIQYLNDPIAAISPAILNILPKIGLVLAPYLEKGNGKGGALRHLRACPPRRATWLPARRVI